MKNRKKHIVESPVVFTSQNKQLVGMLHSVNSLKCIVMCHGFTGNKIENKRLFVEAAREFVLHGNDVLRFDFYGSGDSEGDFADTLISHYIANLKDAVFWCRERGYSKIAVLGISMGAAAAILTVGDLSIDALVTWSAVPDMKQLFDSHAENVGEIVENQTSFEFNGWKIKREFWHDAIKYDIMEALKHLKLPKLIVQGTADSSVFVQGFNSFQDIVCPPTDFMEIPGAGHTFQTSTHRFQVIRQTAIWFDRHFS